MSTRLARRAGRVVAGLRSRRRSRPAVPEAEPHDVIVVGAGISGVIFLKHAAERGLRCLAVEKQGEVGGLWAWVPGWQDIQNRRADFAVGDVPLDGVKQRDIQRYVRAWVDRYGLAPHIRLNTEVMSVQWRDGLWQVETTNGRCESRYLVVASGAHNDPFVPEVDRSASAIVERHSSELRRPEELAGRIVTVVGGGASAWDLLDLALENEAKEIHWAYRNPRWFLPTETAKHDMWPNLREMAVIQSLTGSAEIQTQFLRGLIEREYERLGLEDIEPPEPFDVRHHMLPPGRAAMLEDLDEISRHNSEIRRMRGNELELASEERVETDEVLWGTGYRMDLDYLGLQEYSDVDSVGALMPRLGSLVRSRDYPNLFFVGMTLLESTSATPFFAAVEARSIVSHIEGRCEIPLEPVPHQINHWNLIEHFAAFDHATYPRFWWRVKYFALALANVLSQERNVRV